jgi:hypothetical protein
MIMKPFQTKRQVSPMQSACLCGTAGVIIPTHVDTGGPSKKKVKRVIKQRQSLAEKERGTLVFPMSRIKKIVRADDELSMMSTEACFLVGVATVRHQSEEIL